MSTPDFKKSRKRQPGNREIRLRDIPKPAEGTRTVLKTPPEATSPVLVRGAEDVPLSERVDYLCGKCGAKLVEGVGENQIQNMVLHCNRCDSYNDVVRLPAEYN